MEPTKKQQTDNIKALNAFFKERECVRLALYSDAIERQFYNFCMSSTPANFDILTYTIVSAHHADLFELYDRWRNIVAAEALIVD